MDRGMVRIEDMQLVDFVHEFFCQPTLSVSTLPLLVTLFRLEVTWYTGRALFSDTLLTCILLHRDAALIASLTGNSHAALALEATMTAVSLVSFLANASPIVFEEDFHANLYGMNWWCCTYAGSHFPRSGAAPPGDLELQMLLDRLLLACREDDSRPERFYFARLYTWIRFLNGAIRATLMFGDPIEEMLADLAGAMLPSDLEDQALCCVYPALANLFGLGCVRPVRPVLSLVDAVEEWNGMLGRDLTGFLRETVLTRRPRLGPLLSLLGRRSRDPREPRMLPVTRAIIHVRTPRNCHCSLSGV